ncbi:hypothetical protein Dac01nite_15030 [Demequina activiva]|uniref:Phage shock protein PspC N-terminal domain-containing protein n=1 Tax=Demequina activiva TaxID=1582364 RepID=A0A919Q2N9_9MICO|nr:hypothetical protein Dac01nite_15030 [Demequina activiva]
MARGTNGLVGGVVEGLGQRIGMAAVPARLLTVLAWLLLPGLVMLGYAAAWGLLPDRRGNIIIQNFGRGVTNVGALLGIAVLTLFGFGGLDGGPLFGVFGWGGDPFPWDNLGDGGFHPFRAVLAVLAVLIPLAILAGLVVLVVWLVRRSKNPPMPGAPAPGATPPPPAAPAADGAPAPAPQGDEASRADADVTESQSSPSAPVDAPSQAPGNAGLAAVGATPAATAVHTPQPWEPALLPGDPRAGAAPSRGAAAGARYVAGGPVPPAPPAAGAPAQGPPPASAAAPPAYYGPPAPPAPPRPHVPGPGKGGYLGFLGVLILSAAIVAGLDRAGELGVHPLLAWGACITVGLGAILVIVALAGRKLGFLGFLSVVAVVLSLLLTANAEELRRSYDSSWSWDGNVDVTINAAPEPAPEPTEVQTPIDLSAELASEYGTIYAAGSCTTPVSMEPWEEVSLWGDDTATMRLDIVAEDTAIDLDAAYTHVAVPAGTSIEILGLGTTTVIWENRDISCYDWSEADWDEFGNPVDSDPVRVISATNADDPVLTITGRDGTVIYLEEVAS